MSSEGSRTNHAHSGSHASPIANYTASSPSAASATAAADVASRTSRRSRKGCQTCRRRKVKCDEVTPFCGHCTRLRLTCVYQALRARRASSVAGESNPAGPSSSQSPQKASPWIEQPEYEPSVPSDRRASNNNAGTVSQDTPLTDNGRRQASGYVMSVGNEFGIGQNDISNDDRLQPNILDHDTYGLEILGEENWGNLPIFSDFLPIKGSDFYDFSTSYNSSTTRIALDPSTATSLAQTNLPAADRSASAGNGRPTPQLQAPGSSLGISADEISLLRNFVDFAVPPILVGVEPRWHNARDALLRISKTSALARHAICAFSSLSLGESSPMPMTTGQSSTFYYGLAMGELREALDENRHQSAPKESQECILAGIFFLAYIDLMISTRPQSSLELLQRAHLLLHSKKANSTLHRQLQIWLKLLDAKAVSAGGEGIHLRSTLAAADEERSGSEEADTSVEQIEDILFNSLNRTAYDFYLQVLNFSGRIASLDKWHRSRGSVQDELDVMLAGDKIVKDLNTLWTRRPAILDLADSELRLYMSPTLAIKVQQHLRTYTANFSACYIHLQRVAYAHLQTTAQAKEAVAKIVHLCRLTAQDGHSLSVSMLWPLMMAACEVEDEATQIWLIGNIEDLKSQVGNATRTAGLVREIVKRQRGGSRVDARTVMHETFGTVFAII